MSSEDWGGWGDSGTGVYPVPWLSLHSSVADCIPSKPMQLSAVVFACPFARGPLWRLKLGNFSCEGPDNMLGFLDHTGCVAMTQLCYCGTEVATDDM